MGSCFDRGYHLLWFAYLGTRYRETRGYVNNGGNFKFKLSSIQIPPHPVEKASAWLISLKLHHLFLTERFDWATRV
ncbi:hypothetical protein GCK32_021979 [Trichostrongylus colubriformis]|uniref:Uncharacterized protein n=1 Tax=Trichostrongylus colubriformis TaxID=6319 RepID=A0AAN8FR72_TRICO